MLRIYLHMNHSLFVSSAVRSLCSFSLRRFLIVTKFFEKFKNLEMYLKMSSSLIVKRNNGILR